MPAPLVLSGPISTTMSIEDAGGDPPRIRVRWFVNGDPKESNADGQLMPELLKRGDQVYAEITASKGTTDGPAYRTATVTVVNTPPVIKGITFEPKQPLAGDKIQVKVDALDPDHEDLRFTFKWWRNDKPEAEGYNDTLDTAGFVRGDVIVVAVTPMDQAGKGKEFFSQPYTLPNGVPRFMAAGTPAITGQHYEQTVKAVDPENDPLTFSLESAPPGMVINQKTGHITWTIPPGARGTYKVKVVVKDDHEGWASQEMDFALPASGAAS